VLSVLDDSSVPSTNVDEDDPMMANLFKILEGA